MQTGRPRRAALLKAALLLMFIVAAVLTVRLTGVKELLTVEKLGALLDGRGHLGAPGLHPGLCHGGLPVHSRDPAHCPGGRHLRPLLGVSVYVWVAAMLGATGAFLIGRYLGREFAASLIGDRLKKYDDAIEQNGFATVLYLRLVYFPFTPMNFGMGLTKVRFRDYLWGTGLGILVGTFIFTFFVGTVKEVWATGQWANLLSWKVFFSLGLFVFSLFIPKIINKLKVWQDLRYTVRLFRSRISMPSGNIPGKLIFRLGPCTHHPPGPSSSLPAAFGPGGGLPLRRRTRPRRRRLPVNFALTAGVMAAGLLVVRPVALAVIFLGRTTELWPPAPGEPPHPGSGPGGAGPHGPHLLLVASGQPSVFPPLALSRRPSSGPRPGRYHRDPLPFWGGPLFHGVPCPSGGPSGSGRLYLSCFMKWFIRRPICSSTPICACLCSWSGP